MTNSQKFPIAVSACLMGEPVRYDGGDKLQNQLIEKLRRKFELIPICPEVAIGLGVPRPPIQLVLEGDNVRARGVEDASSDVTDLLESFGDKIVGSLPGLCGYVLKARSPSCGLGSAPLFDAKGNLTGKSNGVYINSVLANHKELPVADEEQLRSDTGLTKFEAEIVAYAKHLNIIKSGRTKHDGL